MKLKMLELEKAQTLMIHGIILIICNRTGVWSSNFFLHVFCCFQFKQVFHSPRMLAADRKQTDLLLLWAFILKRWMHERLSCLDWQGSSLKPRRATPIWMIETRIGCWKQRLSATTLGHGVVVGWYLAWFLASSIVGPWAVQQPRLVSAG